MFSQKNLIEWWKCYAGTTLAQRWHNAGTTLAQRWHNAGTTLAQICQRHYKTLY